MAFFTRPDLDDRQFKQLTGATLTISGTTTIATGGTLNVDGTLTSKGIEIDAATGGTGNTGHVLTYNSGKIDLQPPTGSGGSLNGTFDGERPITQTANKPEDAGNLGTTGITEFLEAYFFPAVSPNTSLVLGSSNNSREFGDGEDTGLGGDTLTWSVDIGTNELTSLTVNGQSITPLAGVTGTTGGTVSYDVTTADYIPATGTISKTTSFTMTADDGVTTPSNSSTTISWKHKRFWFKSSTKYNSGDDALLNPILTGMTNTASSGSELSTSEVKIFPQISFSGEYFYYAYPLQFGRPAFTVNGLPNSAWGNPDDVPSTLFTFSYTNSEGYTETFYLASSDQQLNNTFSISAANYV